MQTSAALTATNTDAGSLVWLPQSPLREPHTSSSSSESANATTKFPAALMPLTTAGFQSPSSALTAWHAAPIAHAGGACPAKAAFCCAARICCATYSSRIACRLC